MFVNRVAIELAAFPKGKHDDQVDSTAQMLDWFKQAGSGRRGIRLGASDHA